MEQNCFERIGSHLFISGKDHTDYPEKDNIITGNQDIRREEILQIFCILRPAKCLKRPQGRRKPCIQSIRILLESCTSAFWTYIRHFASYNYFSAIFTVICRDTMSPPQLSGDAPVTDIVCPVKICFVHSCRNQPDITIFYGFHCRFDQFIHLNEPLFFDHRFYCGMAAVMRSYIMGIIFNSYQKSHTVKFFHNMPAAFVSIKAFIFSTIFVNGSIIIQNVDFRKIMAFSNLKIIRVMRRCDLDNSGTKFHIYITVCHNRNSTIYNRKHYFLSNHIFVSVIFRINGNCRISEHGFRTGRCKFNERCRTDAAIVFDQRVFDMPQMSCLLFIFYFRIRNGCIANRTPVNNTAALVYISFFMHFDKDFCNCFITAFIHRKSFSVPVAGRAQFLKLLNNPAAINFFPFPCTFQKLLTAKIVLVNSFFFQLTDDLNFGCDTGMVCTWLPKGIISLHPFPPDQNVLHGIIKGMSHMELSCNIWRRNYDSIRFFGFINFCMKILFFFPFAVETIFYAFWIICLCKFFFHSISFLNQIFLDVCAMAHGSAYIRRKRPWLKFFSQGRMYAVPP